MANKETLQSSANPEVFGDNRTVFNEVFGTCKICGSGFEGHQFVQLATAPIKSPSEEFYTLLDAAKKEEWGAVVRFHHWEADLPDAEVFMVRCINGTASVAIILCPFQL